MHGRARVGREAVDKAQLNRVSLLNGGSGPWSILYIVVCSCDTCPVRFEALRYIKRAIQHGCSVYSK